MRKFLLPFLALLTVVSCTDDITVVGDDAISIPIIISSLDDVEFESNFSILDVETSSFIVDPGTKAITRESFTIEFNDVNFPNDAADTLLKAVITESSSTNGYTLRFYPQTSALALVGEETVECVMKMWYDDGTRYVRYTLDVFLNPDSPTFYTYPSDIEFIQDFTTSDYDTTYFALNPGIFDIDPDDITLTSDYSRYCRLQNMEIVDVDDSTGNVTFMAVIQPTSIAVSQYELIEDEGGYFTVIYTDNKGDDQSFNSSKKPFNITYPADFVRTGVELGVPDLYLPDNYEAYSYVNWENSVTTTAAGTVSANTGPNYTSQFYIIRESDIVPTLDNFVYVNWDEYSDYFGVGISNMTPAVYTLGHLYRCNISAYPVKSAEQRYFEDGDGETLHFPVDILFITHEILYEESGGTDGYEIQRFNVILPGYNDMVKPTFSGTPSMVFFNSGFYTTTKAYDPDNVSSAYSAEFEIDHDIWTTAANSIKYSIDYGNNINLEWIDEATSSLNITTSTDDGLETAKGYLTLYPTDKAFDYAVEATESYYSKYTSDYNKFAMDTGALEVLVRLDFFNGTTDYTVFSDPIKVRFMPSQPTEGKDQLIYLGEELPTFWVSATDETVSTDGLSDTYTFTWAQARDVCANKEAHPTIPWAWRLPTSSELSTIATQGRLNNAFSSSLNASADESGTTIESGFYERYWSLSETNANYGTWVYMNDGSTGTAAKSTLYRVRCVIDMIQYPDSNVVPDYGGVLY